MNIDKLINPHKPASRSGRTAWAWEQNAAEIIAAVNSKQNSLIVNVCDYGTVSGSDDTAAIKSALTAASGKVLFFPAGTYRFNDTLSLTAPVAMFGEGTGSVLEFFDTTGKNAIEVDTVADYYLTVRLADFALKGTATCGHGIVYNTASSSFNVVRPFLV